MIKIEIKYGPALGKALLAGFRASALSCLPGLALLFARGSFPDSWRAKGRGAIEGPAAIFCHSERYFQYRQAVGGGQQLRAVVRTRIVPGIGHGNGRGHFGPRAKVHVPDATDVDNRCLARRTAIRYLDAGGAALNSFRNSCYRCPFGRCHIYGAHGASA